MILFQLLPAGVSIAEAPAFKKAPGGAPPANAAVGISGLSAFDGKACLSWEMFRFEPSICTLHSVYSAIPDGIPLHAPPFPS
ncbi:unnamed protein product [Victoria cruziana]